MMRYDTAGDLHIRETSDILDIALNIETHRTQSLISILSGINFSKWDSSSFFFSSVEQSKEEIEESSYTV